MLAGFTAVQAVPLVAQTRAGTVIPNTATLHHGDAATPSNVAAVIVAERLDVALASDPDATIADAVAVTLTNRGNGDEAFVVTATRSDGAAASPLAVAVAGGVPLPLADGRTPPIAPGASVTLLAPRPASAPDAALIVSAHAATGSGAPGTVLAGRGDGGGDAVVGATGASATLTVSPALAAIPPTLAKSQAVTAPDGSATPVRGARVAYTLVARFAAATSDAEVVDPIPAGTAFAPGSLTLDGATLADAGHLDAGRLIVPLGAVAAGAVRTLRFTVVIL